MIDILFTSAITNWFHKDIRIKLKTKTSTYDGYEYRLRKYIVPFFKDKKLSEVTSEDIQEFIITLENERTGEALAPNSIHSIAMPLFDFFAYCVEDEMMVHNPCSKVVLPKRKRKKVVTLTKRERSAILRQIEKKPQSRSRLVLVALHTGMRLGELTSLRWEHVDLQNGIIKVKATKIRVRNKDIKRRNSPISNLNDNANKTVVIITEPKTEDSIREVPISSLVFEQLKMQKQYDSEYVFPKNNGTGYDNRGIQKYFKELTASLGIRDKSFHTLRHTFATNALESGMDVKTLSEILGHSDVTTTLNYYVHTNEKRIKKAMEVASAYIGR